LIIVCSLKDWPKRPRNTLMAANQRAILDDDEPGAPNQDATTTAELQPVYG
jgi:hypothetical protein